MARKTVAYKEPASYFNEDMKKAADKWEKENAGKKKPAPKTEVKKPAPKPAKKK